MIEQGREDRKNDIYERKGQSSEKKVERGLKERQRSGERTESRTEMIGKGQRK